MALFEQCPLALRLEVPVGNRTPRGGKGTANARGEAIRHGGGARGGGQLQKLLRVLDGGAQGFVGRRERRCGVDCRLQRLHLIERRRKLTGNQHDGGVVSTVRAHRQRHRLVERAGIDDVAVHEDLQNLPPVFDRLHVLGSCRVLFLRVDGLVVECGNELLPRWDTPQTRDAVPVEEDQVESFARVADARPDGDACCELACGRLKLHSARGLDRLQRLDRRRASDRPGTLRRRPRRARGRLRKHHCRDRHLPPARGGLRQRHRRGRSHEGGSEGRSTCPEWRRSSCAPKSRELQLVRLQARRDGGHVQGLRVDLASGDGPGRLADAKRLGRVVRHLVTVRPGSRAPVDRYPRAAYRIGGGELDVRAVDEARNGPSCVDPECVAPHGHLAFAERVLDGNGELQAGELAVEQRILWVQILQGDRLGAIEVRELLVSGRRVEEREVLLRQRQCMPAIRRQVQGRSAHGRPSGPRRGEGTKTHRCERDVARDLRSHAGDVGERDLAVRAGAHIEPDRIGRRWSTGGAFVEQLRSREAGPRDNGAIQLEGPVAGDLERLVDLADAHASDDALDRLAARRVHVSDDDHFGAGFSRRDVARGIKARNACSPRDISLPQRVLFSSQRQRPRSQRQGRLARNGECRQPWSRLPPPSNRRQLAQGDDIHCHKLATSPSAAQQRRSEDR